MRTKILRSIIFFSFSLLVFGLFYTQILKRSYYEKLSDQNRVRVLALEAPRGKIYDRRGKLLVSSRISFDVEVVFQEIKDKKKLVDSLSRILGMNKEALSKKIEKARKMPFVPVMIVEDIEKEKAIQIEEVQIDLPGVIVATRPVRNYIYKEALSHLAGHLGEISEEELRKFKTYGYHTRDFVGKDGIERRYNDYLRGTDGGLQMEVDNKGRQLRLLAVKEPSVGRDLYLSLDIELQKFCHSLLQKQKGAVIAIEPSTGAILALVSQPDFDPNIFVSPDNFREIQNLLNNSNTFPMLNRAISGAYPPGSVFKIVTATCALDSGRFNDKRVFNCNGSFAVGNRIFHCWKERGHGTQNIQEALKHSCNVFFYQLGLFLGPDKISEYAFKFGLGRPTGIDLPGETSGFIPTPSWKRKALRESWFKGETANYAIGQGYVVVTPIQVGRLICAVANGGKLVQPFVVEKIADVYLHHAEPQNMELSEKALNTLKEGLREVVNAPDGTGAFAKSEEVVIAGKTGTAQNPQGTSHAWFAGFAPFKDPKVAVVIFIEHGGKGGLGAAQFMCKIIEKARELELL